MNDEREMLSSVHRSAFIVHPFPPLYPLTDRHLTGLSHAEQVRRLTAGGARLVQVREKHLPPDEFFQATRDAVRIAHEAGARLIVNDRADIALAAGADGVHLGQTDMPADAARHLLGHKAIVGVSTHTPAQAKAAARLPVSYIAAGPVFRTASKENPDPVIGLDGLRRIRAVVPAHISLVAIGGITQGNARETLAAGATSVAVIGALLAHENEITDQTRRLLLLLADLA